MGNLVNLILFIEDVLSYPAELVFILYVWFLKFLPKQSSVVTLLKIQEPLTRAVLGGLGSKGLSFNILGCQVD